MILGAWISLKWAQFFTACFAMVLLFLVIRKCVFYLAERIFGKHD